MPPFSAAGAAATSQAAVPMVSPAEQAYNSLCYDFPVSVVNIPVLCHSLTGCCTALTS